jgi:hypothetical protein
LWDLEGVSIHRSRDRAEERPRVCDKPTERLKKTASGENLRLLCPGKCITTFELAGSWRKKPHIAALVDGVVAKML